VTKRKDEDDVLSRHEIVESHVARFAVRDNKLAQSVFRGTPDHRVPFQDLQRLENQSDDGWRRGWIRGSNELMYPFDIGFGACSKL